MPVETHDEDVVALVAGGTTPVNKFSKVEKVTGESGPVFNRISHCCVSGMLIRTIKNQRIRTMYR